MPDVPELIAGIDHLVLTVADLEATLAFYERTLGMRRLIEEGRPAALLFGRQKINVHQSARTFDPKARQPTPGAADFCLVAAGPLDSVIRHLETCAVPIELGPVPRTGARGPMTSIYFRDPDGNLVEVCDYGAD
jgi:catechol 2,3-dioxygenase-like lactoylglutathione lyase family enzyme